MVEPFRVAHEYHYFSGKVKFCYLIQPDEKFNQWSTRLYLSNDELNKFNQLKIDKGLLNQVKKDEDGYFVQFKRPVTKEMKGQVKSFTAPIVLNSDGSPFADKFIGHGSDITIKIELYPYTPKGSPAHVKNWACRIQGARIDNLVPYEKQEANPQAPQNLMRGFDEQPEAVF